MSIPTQTGPGPQDLALTYLRMAAERHRTNTDAVKVSDAHRAYFATIARRHGITLQRIADEYGITESAVRAMLKRNGGE